MRAIQIALENENMKQTSMKAFMRNLDNNQSSEVLSDMCDKVTQGIKNYHDGVKRKRSPFFKLTEDMEYSEVAYVGLKTVLGSMSMTQSIEVTLLGTNIGNEILSVTGKGEESFNIDDKSMKAKVQTGIILLDIILDSLPSSLFRATLERLSKSTTVWTLTALPAFEKMLEENEDLFAMFTKKMMPLVHPPDEWSDVIGGGYLTKIAKAITPLVKRNTKHTIPDGDTCYNAINQLQGTPFRVHKWLFSLTKELQGLRPKDLKKIFKVDKGKFEEGCPIDQEADKYLWNKIDGIKITKAGKEKACLVMEFQDEESKSKRKAFFQWVDRKNLHRKKREGKKSLDRSYESCMALTAELEKYERLYWSYSLDRRSRVYPTAMTGINLQGADYQKAVVEFAVGLPLGDQDGVNAMIKTLCNHWGEDSGNGVKTDKLTMVEAKVWVEENSHWIKACALSPLGYTEWMGASKPLQFIVAAEEWLNWCAHWERYGDYSFISHLCDPNDASCSGAQILSAMALDEVGARHTNLYDMEVQDLYMAVAKKVTDNLLLGFEGDDLAQDWLGRAEIVEAIEGIIRGEGHEILSDNTQELIQVQSNLGLDSAEIFVKVYPEFTRTEQDRMSFIVRNLVKKPVMVKFYSGTRYGNIEWCSEYIINEQWEDNFRVDGTGKAASYMGNLIYDSINQVIAGAGKVMEWFVHVAEVFGNLNIPVHWTTPVGFRASIRKFATKNLVINVMFRGGENYKQFSVHIPKHEVLEDGTTVALLDTRKMMSGIAPDIVHSLDASLIMLVSARCRIEGIDNLWMVHDSLGSHCCHSKQFNYIIRDEFRKMFKGDLLQKLYDEFMEQLPENAKEMLIHPQTFGIIRGTYDLDEVMKSEHCFK